MAKKAAAAAPASTPAEPATKPNKSAAIKILLERGVETPKDLSEAAKTQWGLDITPSYASIIKSGLKKKKGKKVRGKAGVTAKAKPKATADGSDLSLENLALRFALKAGGVDQAIAAMRALE